MNQTTKLHERNYQQAISIHQTTVFIDLSKTLWHQQGTNEGLASYLPIYKTMVDGKAMYYQLRPSAERFLQELLKRGYQLVVCTSGPKELRSKVLEMMNLDRYFAAIIGRDELFGSHRKGIHMSAAWVLVDDQTVLDFNARRKLYFLGLRKPCLIDKTILNSKEGKVSAKESAADYLLTCSAWRGGSKGQRGGKPISLDGRDDAPLTALVNAIGRKLVKQYDDRRSRRNANK